MKPDRRTLIAVCSAILMLGLSCARPRPPLLIPDGYASWRRTTDVRLDYPIPGHEDRFRIIHMNDTGFSFSLVQGPSGRVQFPEGTIIAKEIYPTSNPQPADKPVMLTAMVKASSDPDARGGWIWLTKDLATGMEKRMLGDFCVQCHANANEAHPYGWKNPEAVFSDYVFFVPKNGSIGYPAR